MTRGSALAKRIRLALEKDGRARVVVNTSAMVVPYALVQRAVAAKDFTALRNLHPMLVGLGRGSSDLVGILRGSGRVFCLEVKAKGDRLRKDMPEQPRFLAAIRSLGGFACVVKSPEDAVAAVDRACAGASQ